MLLRRLQIDNGLKDILPMAVKVTGRMMNQLQSRKTALTKKCGFSRSRLISLTPYRRPFQLGFQNVS